MLRNLRLLAPVTTLATICEFYALTIVFYYIFRDPLPSSSSVPAVVELSKLPLFFGTAIFAFEGIGIVLPLENRMKEPSHLPGWRGVLNTGMVLVACLYLAMGFYGYIKYGPEVQGIITLNLPSGEALAVSAKLTIMLAIFLTYPLQFYVLISIFMPTVVHSRVRRERWVAAECGVR